MTTEECEQAAANLPSATFHYCSYAGCGVCVQYPALRRPPPLPGALDLSGNNRLQ